MAGLRIAVVGAGIAGLTFAAAWRRRGGGECTIYEQAGELTAAGTGLQLAPNGVRLLQRLGLGDELTRVGVRPEAREIRRWRDGRVVGWTSLGAECEDRFGAPYLTLRRSDLQNCLRAVAGPVELGRRCLAVRETATSAELCLSDGSTAVADLVVGADGIHSIVREALHPASSDRLAYMGSVAHRALVPVPPDRPSRVTVFMGPGAHCVWYPVSDRMFNLVAVVAEPCPGGPAPGDRAAPPAVFDGWHPDVTGMVAAASSWTRWPLYDQPPSTRGLRSRRVALIGDAAQPLLPFAAQGANQAIESAVTLATLLAGGARSGDDLAAALVHHTRLRLPRLRQVAAAVRRNGDDLHLVDGPAQRRRDRTISEHSGLSDQAWLFGYDAEAAAVTSLRTVTDASVSRVGCAS